MYYDRCHHSLATDKYFCNVRPNTEINQWSFNDWHPDLLNLECLQCTPGNWLYILQLDGRLVTKAELPHDAGDFTLDSYPDETDPNFEVAEFVSTKCSLRIRYRGAGEQSEVRVWAPFQCQRILKGLCGDCDGTRNDLSTREGWDMAYLGYWRAWFLMCWSYTVDDIYNHPERALGVPPERSVSALDFVLGSGGVRTDLV